jgi:predicted ATP-grasp superfamily ATP-dependent carboligase
MPMTDAALLLCDRHRDEFPPGTTLAAAPSEAVRNVLDKPRNLATARGLGIPCPAQFELERIEQVPELIDRLGFPLVLKSPGYSSETGRPPAGFKWLVARDERELEDHLGRWCSSDAFPVLQELVVGTVRNLCCFAASGTIVALHEYRGIRRLDWEGNSVLREMTETTPALADYAGRLLGSLRWDGVAQIGFIVRDDDGDARYMETNGRFWGSVEGSIRVGWDFPLWTYRYFTAGKLPQPPPIMIGSKTCWRHGDLRLLAARLSGREAATPLPHPGRARAVADYVSGFRPGIRSDVFTLDDPLPSLVEHWTGVRQALARRLSPMIVASPG